MGVTRKDVARLAGVSTATVSYVINNGPRAVSAEARRRVLRAIEQLGYQPNAIARSLATRRTHTIGFMIPDILNPVHAAIAKAFGDVLRDAEYGLLLANSDESPQAELAHLQVFLGKQVDGIALTPTGANRRYLFSLVEAGKHLVTLDRQLEGLDVDCVLFDNVAGARAATRHLLDLGHRRIALINLPRDLTPGRERFEGYQRALLEAGLNVDAGLVHEGQFKAGSVGASIDALLRRPDRPTALVASSNRLAEGALLALRERGLQMPDDLALCVFDDVPAYAYTTPTISAVATDVADFGRQATRLLLDRIAGGAPAGPQVVRIPCRLRARESTLGKGRAAPERS